MVAGGGGGVLSCPLVVSALVVLVVAGSPSDWKPGSLGAWTPGRPREPRTGAKEREPGQRSAKTPYIYRCIQGL